MSESETTTTSTTTDVTSAVSVTTDRKDETTEKNEEEKTVSEKNEIKRLSKKQIEEIYNLFEEGKNFDEVSRFFEEKYRCRPLKKQKLQYYFRKFRAKKEGNEKSTNNANNKDNANININNANNNENKTEDMTKEDIEEIKKIMSSPPKNLKENDESTVLYEKENNKSFLNIDFKYLIIGGIVIIIIVLIFLYLRKQQQQREHQQMQEQKQKEEQEKAASEPYDVLKNPNIVWV